MTACIPAVLRTHSIDGEFVVGALAARSALILHGLTVASLYNRIEGEDEG